MKTNVWHSIEQRTIDASIDQWHSRLKRRIYAEGRADILCTWRKL